MSHQGATGELQVRGSSRLAYAASTAALIALASVGTAILVSEGTAIVASPPAPSAPAAPDARHGESGLVVERAPGTWKPAPPRTAARTPLVSVLLGAGSGPAPGLGLSGAPGAPDGAVGRFQPGPLPTEPAPTDASPTDPLPTDPPSTEPFPTGPVPDSSGEPVVTVGPVTVGPVTVGPVTVGPVTVGPVTVGKPGKPITPGKTGRGAPAPTLLPPAVPAPLAGPAAKGAEGSSSEPVRPALRKARKPAAQQQRETATAVRSSDPGKAGLPDKADRAGKADRPGNADRPGKADQNEAQGGRDEAQGGAHVDWLLKTLRKAHFSTSRG